jgi:HAD superfamily hydrolase (TIGR01509 family)
VSSSIRALLFDFDGLLLDTESACYRAWCELYGTHGHELTLDVWSAAIGTVGGFDAAAHLAALTGTELTSEAREAKRRRELDLCELEELRPGVTQLLDEAGRRGLATAIVSSSEQNWIEGHLEPRGVLHRFDAVVCANGDRERAKPRPTLYVEALGRLGVTAEQAVAFEDSPNGVAAAKAAGLPCVAVPNEITGALDLSAADVVAASLADVDLDVLAEGLVSAHWAV